MYKSLELPAFAVAENDAGISGDRLTVSILFSRYILIFNDYVRPFCFPFRNSRGRRVFFTPALLYIDDTWNFPNRARANHFLSHSVHNFYYEFCFIIKESWPRWSQLVADKTY